MFNSSAILLYLGEKTGRFIGTPPTGPNCCRGCSSSPPASVRFRPGGAFPARGAGKAPLRHQPLPARDERHYRVLDRHLAGRDFIVGDYSIADMSAWGWLAAPPGVPGADDPLAEFPNIKRLFETVAARPAASRAKAVGKDHRVQDETPTKRRSAQCTRRTIRKSRCEPSSLQSASSSPPAPRPGRSSPGCPSRPPLRSTRWARRSG